MSYGKSHEHLKGVEMEELTEFKTFIAGAISALLSVGADADIGDDLPVWIRRFRRLEPQRTSEQPDAHIRDAFAEVDQ
jgi:hypothetical protein